MTPRHIPVYMVLPPRTLLLDVAGFVAIVPCATWLVPWLMKM